jgi:CheY-like chemotaxis protein
MEHSVLSHLTAIPRCSVKSALRWICCLLALAAVSAQAQESAYIQLDVSKGDNLYNICQQYFQSPQLWHQIARLNRLKNPERIYPGEKIRVPVNLLEGLPLDGIVTLVIGQADLRPSGDSNWRPVNLGDRLRAGDRLRTGVQATLEITYPNGIICQLRESTRMEVIRAMENGTAFRIHDLLIQAGRMLSRIRKSTGVEQRYRTHTASAIAGARKTEFQVSVDPMETTRCKALDGRANVAAKHREVAGAENQGTLVKKDAAPAVSRPLLPPPQISRVQPLYRKLPITFTIAPYRVSLARDSQLRELLREHLMAPGEPGTFSKLADGSYCIGAQAIDADGLEGAPSLSCPVVLRVNPLPPFIAAPSPNEHYHPKRTDPRRAQRAFAADPGDFDVVITDMAMPGLTGEQLAEKIRQIRPDIPVILGTGYSERIDPEKARDLGIQGFLYKPLSVSDLARVPRQVLVDPTGDTGYGHDPAPNLSDPAEP